MRFNSSVWELGCLLNCANRCALLGNDIVDLRFCESPKKSHVHYLDRACTLEEAEAVRRSVSPARALALVWACKEAAYKLFSKQLKCHFVPSQFAIQIEDRDPVLVDKKLSVLYAGAQTEVSLFAEELWVHAVAISPGMRIHWAVREIEKCFAGRHRASHESEAVRSLANALLDDLGLRDVNLQFEGRIPQLRRKGGGQAGIDVSLAHHGEFAAAAIAWPACYVLSRRWDEASFVEGADLEVVCSTCTA